MCAQRRVTYDAVPNKCAEDAAHLCTEPHMIDQVAHKVPCLRKHRNKVSQACWDSLLKLASDGWEFLPNRFKHLSVDSPCTSALVRACGNIAPGFGALHQCVDRHWALLAEDVTAIRWSPGFLLSLGVLSLFGTAAVFVLWFTLLERARLTQLNVFTFLTPVFGLAMGTAFFAETIELAAIVGIGLSLIGIYLVTRPPVAAAGSSRS